MPGRFVDDLLAAADHAGARTQVAQVLERWAGQRVYLPMGPPSAEVRAAEIARRLVFGGVGTRAAAAMVRERFGLSSRHARRLVRAAVDMRGQRMADSRRTIEPRTTEEAQDG